METSFTNFLKKVEALFLYATIGLIPLIFYPATSEPFELSKYTVFFALTFAALMCFLGRSMLLKQVVWRRTPLDASLLLLWSALLLGSIFSLTPYESFFGDFTFLGVSWLAVTSFIIFYWLLVQHLTTLQQVWRCLLVLLGAGLVATVYFLLQVFKAVPFPTWLSTSNPVSASNSAWGLFLIILVVASLTVLAIHRAAVGASLLAAVTLFVSVAGLLFVGSQMVWILLAVALGLTLMFFLTYLDQLRSWWSSLAFSLLVVAILFAILGTPAWFTANRPGQIDLGYGHSLAIARDSFVKGSWKNRLLGSGPSTYIYTFSTLRPAAVNAELFWNSRFYHSASSALDWFTENGLVSSLLWIGIGLIGLGIIFATWFKSVRDLKLYRSDTLSTPRASESPLIFWGVATVWLTLVIGLVVLNVGAAHWVLFWAFTACLVATSFALGSTAVTYKEISLRATPQYALIISFGFILLFTGLIILGIYFGRFVQAEIIYTKSLFSKGEERISLLNQALRLNTNRSFFYLNLADAWLAQARQLSTEPDRANESYQALSTAIQAAKTVTTLAPYNVASWQILASVYTSAASLAPDATNWIGQSLERARELEPSNPLVYVALATVQANNQQFAEAVGNLEQAISLKPDLLEAYFRLGLLYEANDQTPLAIKTLQSGFPYGRNNPDYLVQLGKLFFNNQAAGDDTAADALFQQAIYLNSSHSDALFSLAVLRERQGKITEALTLYRQVLALNPGNKDLIKKINSVNGASTPSL